MSYKGHYFAPGEEEFFKKWLAKNGYLQGTNLIANWVFLFRKGIYGKALDHFGFNPDNATLIRWLRESGHINVILDFNRHKRRYLKRNYYLSVE